MFQRITPAFLGLCVKHAPARPADFPDPRVEEICTFSECLARRPERWVDRGDFNAASLYDTAEAALAAGAGAAAAELVAGTLRLFAYDFYPIRFAPGGPEGYDEKVITPQEIFGEKFASPSEDARHGLGFLGFDVVERDMPKGHESARTLGGAFGCSPLSCNLMCRDFAINRHCLLTDFKEALQAARRFAREQPEPGCYFIFGVWHQALNT